jgi:glycosyltransferase involved in cell wall biosynthesis
MPGLLRSASVVASTPAYEPFGLVPLEAMACGVPVVATAVGGHLDTIVDGVTGVLVSPGRPDLTATALKDVLADPVQLDAYGVAGADRARSRYSWDRVAAATVRLYEDVLGIARPASAVEAIS